MSWRETFGLFLRLLMWLIAFGCCLSSGGWVLRSFWEGRWAPFPTADAVRIAFGVILFVAVGITAICWDSYRQALKIRGRR